MSKLLDQPAFCRATKLAPRRVIYLCERGIIHPAQDTLGRGRARKFSQRNVVEANLAEYLLKIGYAQKAVQELMRLVRDAWTLYRQEDPSVWFVCVDHVYATFRDARGDCGWVQRLPNGISTLICAPVPQHHLLEIRVDTSVRELDKRERHTIHEEEVT